MNEIKNHARKWFYWFTLGVAIIVVYKALDSFPDVMKMLGDFFSILSPFLVGILISYLLYIPCQKIERAYRRSKTKAIKKRARGLGVFTVYMIVLLLLIILFNFILPVVIESIMDLIGNMQTYIETAIQRYNQLPADSFFKGQAVQEIVKEIQHIDIKQYFNIDKIFVYIMSAINAVTGLFNVFVAVVVSVYILLERTQIVQFLKRFANAVLKDTAYKNLNHYFKDSNEIFFRFIASQFLDAIVIGVLTTIAMSIMGIRYAPLLGFFIGLFNMIPYIGAIIAISISALITLITGGMSQTIWMLIVVIILQQIDANIINPKIVGQSLKISPILIIFAVTVGGAYFGIIGMFLAVPLMAVIKIIIEDYVTFKLVAKKEIS